MDSHNLEQHEVIERSRAYAKRLETIGIKVPEQTPSMLKDIPALEKVLTSESLSTTDKELVSTEINYFSI